VDAGVVDGEDVGMVQLSGGAPFLLEAMHAARVRRGEPRDQLDRDVAAEARVACAVNVAHATGADPPGDLVGADCGAGGQRAIRVSKRGPRGKPAESLQIP
jgi:hypothetical protein